MDDFPDDHDLLMNIATQGLVPIEHGLSGQADYDSCDFFDEILSQVSLPDTDKPKGETRFANPVSDQQVQEAQLKAIPANTKKAIMSPYSVYTLTEHCGWNLNCTQ